MSFGKSTAAVLLTASAVAVATATAHADPAVISEAATVSGVDHGIGYRIDVSSAGRAVTATVENGTFALAPGGAVTLEASDGTAVMEVPRSFTADGRSIALTPRVAADGRTLTLTPSSPADDVASDISSYDRLVAQIDKNLPGVVGGAIAGGLLGACLILIWGVSIPLGVLIGGTLGGYATGGPEFLAAVQAFVTGQP